ncbi:hypothetical protein [Gloeobacter kilaueensis]|uniref:Uncharacterized protein n=1 Tax=Gloeobacter kilaueensis (strain ATCC BAA-2537 / CCAP 1431/1 / ULC 316 / JS1) TaxID=1183438 RepID=U5QLG9_GLOK1|nr:hypothetical protein [Gloeobacter kilaueensis]AGY58444.1 hypothetical protein GKIL_2198 [Gloeobacter kilaueensis JS1]
MRSVCLLIVLLALIAGPVIARPAKRVQLQLSAHRPGAGAAYLAATLQPRHYRFAARKPRLERIARRIGKTAIPTFFAGPPPGFSLDRTLRNTGYDTLAILLWPLGLGRAQIEYLADRGFEAASGQNVRLFEAKW